MGNEFESFLNLKEAMKESPRRYINPFLSDEENEKLNLWNEELEHSNIEHDKLRNSLGPSEFCEKETELYMDKNVMECELPELLICYKEGAFHVKDICVDEGTPHGERILFDENDDQMQNSELLRFSYMESNLCSGTSVKSETGLPVLEPSNDHMNIGENHDEAFEKKSDAFSGAQEVDADLPVNRPINDQNDVGKLIINTEISAQDLQNSIPDCKECGYKEEVSDSVGRNELKGTPKDDCSDGNGISKSAPDRSMFSSESVIVSKATENDGLDISVQPGEKKIDSSENLLHNVSTEQVVSNSGPSLEQDRILPSLKSLLESIDQQPFQSPVEISKRPFESGNTVEGTDTLNFNSIKPATSSEHVHNIKNFEHVDELFVEPNGAPKLHDVGSDEVASVNPVHRGGGESSFSVAGPGVEHITYSGPIAFSGSTSLRSDSSTTSTRSFAFPILQNEWNSSPVRMAKADRRRLQKHRGWRHGLLCCRF